jgi:hypothetical protein
VFRLTISTERGGGGWQAPNTLHFSKKIEAHLKDMVIYFIDLKWSLDIFRKSHEASAFNFDHKVKSKLSFMYFKFDYKLFLLYYIIITKIFIAMSDDKLVSADANLTMN